MLKVIDDQKPKRKGLGCIIIAIIILLLITSGLVAVYAHFANQIGEAYHILFNPNTTTTPTLAAFHVDGSIYFVKNKNIYKASGSDITQMTHTSDIDEARISQDGAFAIYTKINPNYSDLYLLDLKTNQATLLTKGSNSKNMDNNVWNANATFSPDSKKIVYISDKSKFTAGNSDLSIFQMDLTTKISKQLTQGNPYTGGDQDPTYYPLDATYILYTKYIYALNQPQPFSQLMLLNTATKISYALTPDTTSALEASFSPDGKHIVYVERETIDGNNDKATNMYLLPFNIAHALSKTPAKDFLGDYTQKILLNSGLNSMPTFSQDGNSIAFISAQDKMVLATIDLQNTTDANGNPTITPSKAKIISQFDPVTATSPISWLK